MNNVDFHKKILDCVIGRNSLCGVLLVRLRGFFPLALPTSFSESLRNGRSHNNLL